MNPNEWQRWYWERLIRNECDYARQVDYIHFNSVKHGFIKRTSDWPHSSIRRYIQAEFVDQDWGMCEGVDGENGYSQA